MYVYTRTTVVDPRTLKLDRFSRKLRWGVYHDTQPLQHFNSEVSLLLLLLLLCLFIY